MESCYENSSRLRRAGQNYHFPTPAPSGWREPMHPAGHHVLLVDHDPARRAEVERLLIGEGFAVMPIGDGLAAIRAARQGRFALAVAALGLPGALDGPATVGRGRRPPPWPPALYAARPGR